MNEPYLPLSCLVFCVVYIFVADSLPAVKLFMIIAALVFGLLLFRARGGRDKGGKGGRMGRGGKGGQR